MRSYLLAMMLFGFATFASSNSEFEIDEGLVEGIFRDSVAMVEDVSDSSAMEISVSFVLLHPSNWKLKNDYFQAQYADNIDAFPSIEIAANFPMARFGNFTLEGGIGTGYGVQNGVYSVQASGGQTRTDNVQVHRVPVSAALQLEYRFTKVPVRPYLALGAGLQWNYQVGSLDGFNQGFWIPFVQIRPGLVLFAPDGTSQSWFGGINLGVGFLESFATKQQMSAMGVELGINVFL